MSSAPIISPHLFYEIPAALIAAAVAWFVYRRFSSQKRLLAESQLHLDLVLHNIDEGVLVIGPDRTILLNSQAAARTLRSTSPSYDSIDQQFECFTPVGDPIQPDRWPSARALRGDFVHKQLVCFRRKDGSDMGTREISTAPVPGRPGQFILVYHDDADLRRIDEARTRLAAIVESSDDAIIGKDPSGIITSWNHGAEKIFGYTASEMIGQSIKRLLPPNRAEEEDEILERILADETVDHFNTTRLTKDGRTIQVSLTISPIKDAAGKIIGASKIARDITETTSLARQLHHSQKMEAIGQLTGGIAHDFNNLLGIIIGNLDLLEQELPSHITTREEADLKRTSTLKRTQTALKAAARGAELTQRLLAFSSKEQLKPVAMPLQLSIHNMMEMASRALGPEIVISTNLDEKMPPVFVDPASLESALLNLMVNARDAMPKGGSLRIATRPAFLDETHPQVLTGRIQPGPYALVSVSDNGHGMSKQTLERVFEPFFTTKPRGKGTGLGLAMVYGFAQQSKGTALVYSEPGYGTTVSLYLPFAEHVPTPLADGPVQHQSSSAGGTILLVDDEEHLLDIASAYLDRIGYQSLLAKDAADALRLLAHHDNIDLMVTDIIMPGEMNGIELGQRVLQLRPAIKIVFTSGYPADALTQKNFTLGDSVLLHKPYRLADLGAAIHRSMEEKNAEQDADTEQPAAP